MLSCVDAQNSEILRPPGATKTGTGPPVAKKSENIFLPDIVFVHRLSSTGAGRLSPVSRVTGQQGRDREFRVCLPSNVGARRERSITASHPDASRARCAPRSSLGARPSCGCHEPVQNPFGTVQNGGIAAAWVRRLQMQVARGNPGLPKLGSGQHARFGLLRLRLPSKQPYSRPQSRPRY